MPDIIEENEGEGEISRRAQAHAHALVVVRAARAAAVNNPNHANVAAGNIPRPAAPNAAEALTAEMTEITSQIARLSGAHVRPMFSRLGVRSALDIKYIREKDLDGLPRITPIQKRKVWAVLKYIATDNPPLTARTTLSEIAKTLNANKRKDKESSASGSSSTIQVSKLQSFDGSHSDWLLWKKRSQYALAQTSLGPLLEDGNTGIEFAKKNPALDHLFFNLLAEALVGGSAAHWIAEAEQRVEAASLVAAAADAPNAPTPHTKPSGIRLWKSLHEHYSKGPMSFWILSDARQVLQQLHLLGSDRDEAPSSTSSRSSSDPFVVYSAHDYVNRFRAAKDTLAEFQQALPDPFLASNFVEHIYDDRLETIKKQLLRDVSTKNLSLEDCMKELLMSDHLLRVRRHNNNNKSKYTSRAKNRKRSRSDEPKEKEYGKRFKADEEGEDDDDSAGDSEEIDEPDETIS
jgi:hypothetical protein